MSDIFGSPQLKNASKIAERVSRRLLPIGEQMKVKFWNYFIDSEIKIVNGKPSFDNKSIADYVTESEELPPQVKYFLIKLTT